MTDLIECIVGDINNETEDGEEELPPVDQSHPANMVRAGEEEMPF